jgi:hypothetical protein
LNTRALLLALSLAVTLAMCGCVGGPSYAGGPTEEEPHGLLIPGEDVSFWRVDGFDVVESRKSPIYVAPGRRKVHARFETPIDADESKESFEYRDLEVDVVDGERYLVERTGEGAFGPFDLRVRARSQR